MKLMASSISSSTAFPQGEAIQFSFSARGRILLGLSSSRIFVLDVASEKPIVKHELKTLRRPLGATILDDGSLLAVVSSKYQANIYRLSTQEAKHVQALTLDDTPRALALSPTGGVLAIAYHDGIEVHALGKDVLAPQRRAVHCVGVDSLYFSTDETMLWGTSADFKQNDIFTITAPFYDEPETDLSPQDVQIRMWTTQVLFPSIISGYSHACSIQAHDVDGADNWVVAYDKRAKAFRTVRVSDAKAGIPFFAGPLTNDRPPSPASPVTIPATDHEGNLVTIGSRDNGIWLYSMPDKVAVPRSAEQVVDEPLVSGHKIDGVPGITAACWVLPGHSPPQDEFCRRRLIAVAPGGLGNPIMGEEDMPIESGRVLILDFERSARNGEALEVDIEFGESQPLLLKEHIPGMDVAVELERSRTVQHAGPSSRGLASRSATTRVAGNATSMPRITESIQRGGVSSSQSRNVPRRSVTAVQATSGRYRAPNGRFHVTRMPHESDANNWIPPPPPYTRDLNGPLPDYARGYYLDSSAVYGGNNMVVGPRTARTAYAPQQRVHGVLPNSLVEGFDRMGVGGQPQPLLQPDLQLHNMASGQAASVQLSNATPPPAPLSYQPTASGLSQNPTTSHRQQYFHAHAQVASNYSFSVSSPALRGQTGQQNAVYSADTRTRPIITRRASTDPTHAVTLVNPNEEWRQRIENWNEQTIRANKRKTKIKCVVM